MYTKVQLGRTTPDFYEVKVAWIPTRLATIGAEIKQRPTNATNKEVKIWMIYDIYYTIGKNICLAKINNGISRSLSRPSDENWRKGMTQQYFFDTERERMANVRAWLND